MGWRDEDDWIAVRISMALSSKNSFEHWDIEPRRSGKFR
jgi:hypothetical protein